MARALARANTDTDIDGLGLSEIDGDTDIEGLTDIDGLGLSEIDGLSEIEGEKLMLTLGEMLNSGDKLKLGLGLASKGTSIP